MLRSCSLRLEGVHALDGRARLSDSMVMARSLLEVVVEQ